MTDTLKFELLLTGGDQDDVVAHKTIEIVCMYGTPAIAPLSLSEIPFTIKEVLVEGKVQDFHVRHFLIETMGGADALKDACLMRVKGASA